MDTLDILRDAVGRGFTPCVMYVVGGKVALWGLAEYVTDGGWVGVRQPGGRLDEVRGELVQIDPS